MILDCSGGESAVFFINHPNRKAEANAQIKYKEGDNGIQVVVEAIKYIRVMDEIFALYR